MLQSLKNMSALISKHISKKVILLGTLAGVLGAVGPSVVANPRTDVVLESGAPRPDCRRWIEPVVEQRPVKVWVEAIYRTVCDEIYVKPVYEVVCDRRWLEPVYEKRCERVLVPEVVEFRDISHFDNCGRRFTAHDRVVVCPAHYENRETRFCVCEGHWEKVERQVCVSEGHYRHVDRQELVTPAHYETRLQRIEVLPGHWEQYTAVGFEMRTR